MKFHCQKVESTRNGKLRRLYRRFQNLIMRPGKTVQNLESPGLYGRVESPLLGHGLKKEVHEFHRGHPVTVMESSGVYLTFLEFGFHLL